MRRTRSGALAASALAAACLAAGALAQNPAAELEAPAVDVVGTTPLPGVGTPLSQVPANVQTATDRRLEALPTPALPDFLERAMGGFVSATSQGNPFQSDVSFRGFSASPLLGTPQGLSVYVDGVRVNESFGDVVNWDLIPKNALSSITVIPGSNPVFGLNTLGGALAIITKSGSTYPGLSAQTYGGSFGRRSFEVEAGGSRGNTDFFVAGTGFREAGWREHSSSEINQLFAKVGYEDERNDLDFSVIAADNKLTGTQALPLSMLGSPRQPYTWPDETDNRMAGLNLRASRVIDAAHLVFANLYYRETKTRVFNSNVNDDCTVACTFTAVNNLTRIDQDRIGASAQYTSLARLAGRKNQLTVGGNVDTARTRFTGESQEADFAPDRGTVPLGEFQPETAVRARQGLYSTYVQDVFSATDAWHVTLAASANGARVRIEDTTGTQPALDGEHRFFRVNPAAGVAYSPRPEETWYANYSEGMRAPTPVELTCADPAAPCRLPNIFLADPPLNKVVSRTVELGLRLAPGATLRASAAVFRTELRDDIQFISTSGTAINSGFFQNVGDTRRQGVELALEGAPAASVRIRARYAYVDATFESPFTAFSPNNSSADASGDIRIGAGDRIPGIPRHNFKLRIEGDPFERATLGASLVAFSSQYARGDENNRDGNGPVPGYALVDLDARWRFARGWELFGTLTNLFDRSYASFGVLGANFFTGAGGSFDPAAVQAEQFRTPGQPRAVWVGLRYEAGREK